MTYSELLKQIIGINLQLEQIRLSESPDLTTEHSLRSQLKDLRLKLESLEPQRGFEDANEYYPC